MKLSVKGLDYIKRFEGLRLTSYKDSIGILTIGYGCIKYPDGGLVKVGDTCTLSDAEHYLMNDLIRFEKGVNNLVKVTLTQNQFDALVSFCYNLGVGSLEKSTMLKMINNNPNDPLIKNQFALWCNAGGKPNAGLLIRRKKEAEIYFS